MADCVIVPSHVKLLVRRYCVSEHCASPKDVHFGIPSFRKSCAASYKVNPLSSIGVGKPSAFSITNLKVRLCRKESPMKCHCFGTLMNSGGMMTSDWIPIVDQVLLMTSVFLTYMAGVIPAEKSPFNSQQSTANDRMVPDEASVSGSAVNDDDDEVNLTFAWEIVRKKLLDSLNIIENKGNVGNGVTESGQQRPASLFAISEAPRFRLLLASFHRLKKEAGIVFIMFLPCIYTIYLYNKNVIFTFFLKDLLLSIYIQYNEVGSLSGVPYKGLCYFYLAIC